MYDLGGTYRPIEPADWSIMSDSGESDPTVSPTACQSNTIMLLSGAPRIILLLYEVQLISPQLSYFKNIIRNMSNIGHGFNYCCLNTSLVSQPTLCK